MRLGIPLKRQGEEAEAIWWNEAHGRRDEKFFWFLFLTSQVIVYAVVTITGWALADRFLRKRSTRLPPDLSDGDNPA